MRLAVQHGLVDVRRAPPLGDIAAQKPAQFIGRRAGGCVLPGAERHQKAPVLAERQIAVHHGGYANAAQRLQLRPVDGAHLCLPAPLARLQRVQTASKE